MIDKNEITSINYEYAKLSELLKLIDKDIYVIKNNKVYKFKIVDIKISKIDSKNYGIDLTAVPAAFNGMSTYYDDIEISLNQANKDYYYSYEAALSSLQKLKGKQLSLF